MDQVEGLKVAGDQPDQAGQPNRSGRIAALMLAIKQKRDAAKRHAARAVELKDAADADGKLLIGLMVAEGFDSVRHGDLRADIWTFRKRAGCLKVNPLPGKSREEIVRALDEAGWRECITYAWQALRAKARENVDELPLEAPASDLLPARLKDVFAVVEDPKVVVKGKADPLEEDLDGFEVDGLDLNSEGDQ